ncbi:MAG: aminoglycoside phosphotransferase family protein [Actinomycetota bacterium]|nr:aminoglycoside phosphotransferase family protein [Actinomycetota bacterium]
MTSEPQPLPPGLGWLFGITGRLIGLEPLAGGHIHDTFLAVYSGADGASHRHVHQRVNAGVFTDPAALTDKVDRVSRHLAALGIPAPALTMGPGGRPYVVDGSGAVWRSWPYREGARSFRRFPSPAVATVAAAGFGRLLAALVALPGPPPAEAIPGFHDVDRRLAAFEAALAADRCSRAAGCGAEIDAVRAAAEDTPVELSRARMAGRLLERVVHNDAKADNVLIDDHTGAVAAILDLDTVAPGTVLFDLGDLVRSGAPTQEAGGAAPEVRLAVVEALVRGYLEGAAGVLTDGETGLFGLAGPLMAYESALRYLTDHLDGDRYFGADRPGHNLDRARVQLSLLRQLLELRPAVEAAVDRLRR